MALDTQFSNPFLLMMNPEVVLTAMAKSEKLGRLNRRTCHPLDRPVPATAEVSRKPPLPPLDDDEWPH